MSEITSRRTKFVVRCIATAAVALLAFLSGIAGARAESADSTTAKRNDRVGYLIHLLSQQRYAEAAQGVQQLFIDYPNDAGSYEVRGVLRLHVGAIPQARRDFEEAHSMASASDMLPAYGLALCAIYTRDFDTASKMLTIANMAATPSQKDDITIARAIVAGATGDNLEAIRLATPIDRPVAQEIAALAAYDKSPTDGLPLIEKFVADAVVGGIPRVTEDTGLRFVGSGGKDGSVIEPSLTETVLQGMFAQRLSSENSPANQNNNDVVRGVTPIGPEGNLVAQTGQTDLVVAISIDGHLLGLANSQPFQVSWDSRDIVNGVHLIKFEISDSHGAVLQTQYRKVKTANPGNDLSQPSEAFPVDIAGSLWSLLTIQPAYKAAEYTLAQAYNANNDRSRAANHIVIAAALDCEYRNVGEMVAKIFTSPRRSYRLATASYNPPVRSGDNQAGEMWTGSTKLKEIALTFDDGPSPQITPILLDNLKKAGIPGTFFVVGIRATAAPDLLRNMKSDGFEVENHTYTHPNLGQCLPQHILEEYLRNGIVISSLTGRWPCFLRPPGGNSNPQVMQIAHKCGMIGGFWTIDALRAEDTGSADQVAEYVVAKARPGAIVLMHNGSAATANAIEAMAAGLKAKGYKCVTLAQLAHDSGISLP